MPASVHDQPHLAGLFDTGEVGRLFSASAEVRAMLIVEGALAEAQGKQGTIPELSAAAIQRAALEVEIDPAGLADETALNGVSVPALVGAFRAAIQAPEHAQFVHWGATSQDIIDTALMLRLRQATALILTDLDAALAGLGNLAELHAETAMMARTYGQHAAPTSFGAVVASWGWPLLEARANLAMCSFPVSLSGAAGTASALGADPVALRAAVAEALRLTDPGRSWHTDRMPIRALAGALCQMADAAAKMGEDLIALTQSEVAEVRLSATGASSTMPQKQNPVAPSVIVATAGLLRGLLPVTRAAGVHRFQRDGAAWFAEWMSLPQIVLGAATIAAHARRLADSLEPDPGRMMQTLSGGDGAAFAEALSFALCAHMSRPEAQREVKRLAAEMRASGTPLPELARAAWPDLPDDLFAATASLGTAPGDARAFAAEVRAL